MLCGGVSHLYPPIVVVGHCPDEAALGGPGPRTCCLQEWAPQAMQGQGRESFEITLRLGQGPPVLDGSGCMQRLVALRTPAAKGRCHDSTDCCLQ